MIPWRALLFVAGATCLLAGLHRWVKAEDLPQPVNASDHYCTPMGIDPSRPATYHKRLMEVGDTEHPQVCITIHDDARNCTAYIDCGPDT